MPVRLLLLVVLAAGALRATPFDDALALVKAKRYPEAQAALETLVAAEPNNAAACHELGLLWRKRDTKPNDNSALETALKWLGRAAELEPNNAVYIGDFGGSEMQYAGRVTSLSAAYKGRDAMEKAIALDPNYLDAREGLFEFYTNAPWPIGSSSKAEAQLVEIKQRDPDRGTVLEVIAKVQGKDYAAAFTTCDAVLARTPDNYTALYQYGRTASIAGDHLQRGLACLQRCLTLDPPGPASPTHSNVWNRIGLVQEKLHHPAEARAAYTAALKEDPNNRQAADALAKLK